MKYTIVVSASAQSPVNVWTKDIKNVKLTATTDTILKAATISPDIWMLSRTTAKTTEGYAPIWIRTRKYGFIEDYKILIPTADTMSGTYNVTLETDTTISDADTVASAYTGIAITDYGDSPYVYRNKKWGIVITANPSLKVSNIYHYLRYKVSQVATFGDKSGLDWHNLITVTNGKYSTNRGMYDNFLMKGVLILDTVGNLFPGISQFVSDDSSILSGDEVTISDPTKFLDSIWSYSKRELTAGTFQETDRTELKAKLNTSAYVTPDNTSPAEILNRLTLARASNLDKIDANISTRAIPADLKVTVSPTAVTVSGGFTDTDRTELKAKLNTSAYVSPSNADITEILNRLTTVRASNLDKLDANITTRAVPADLKVTVNPTAVTVSGGFTDTDRTELKGKLNTSTYVSPSNADTTEILNRLTVARASNLDKLDANITTRAIPADLKVTVNPTAVTVSGGFTDTDRTELKGKLNTSAYVTPDNTSLTEVLNRLTITRATNLDKLDANISSRATSADVKTTSSGGFTDADRTELKAKLNTSAYVSPSNADITELLSRLSVARAANLDKLDANISTRAIASDLKVTVNPPSVSVSGGFTDTDRTELKNKLNTSSYLVPDNISVAEILNRLTVVRATNLDKLDANISTRATNADVKVTVSGGFTEIDRQELKNKLNGFTYIQPDNNGLAEILNRLTVNRASNLDKLDANVSSRATLADLKINLSGGFTETDRIELNNKLNTSTFVNSPTAVDGINNLLDRLSVTRASNLDYLSRLDVKVSSRATPADLNVTLTPATVNVSGGFTEADRQELRAKLNSSQYTIPVSTDSIQSTIQSTPYIKNLQNLDAPVSTRATPSDVSTTTNPGSSTSPTTPDDSNSTPTTGNLSLAVKVKIQGNKADVRTLKMVVTILDSKTNAKITSEDVYLDLITNSSFNKILMIKQVSNNNYVYTLDTTNVDTISWRVYCPSLKLELTGNTQM